MNADTIGSAIIFAAVALICLYYAARTLMAPTTRLEATQDDGSDA